MPHHLAPFIRNLWPGPLTIVNPSEPGTRPKWKNVSFYACYHANGGGPIFVTISCLRFFVFTFVVFICLLSLLVYSFINFQQSVCLIAIKLKSSLNWDLSYVNCNSLINFCGRLLFQYYDKETVYGPKMAISGHITFLNWMVYFSVSLKKFKNWM